MPGLPVAGRRVRQMDVDAMIETRRRDEGIVFLALFTLTIPVANWLIGHAGTVCQPQGPCLIPVAPGLMAPSGVTMAGVALVLRDLGQRRLGGAASSLAILAGAALSALLAPAPLRIASAGAFLLSQIAGLAVYTPLARGGLAISRAAFTGGGLVGCAFRVRFVAVREDLATPESWAKPISTRGAIEEMPAGCIVVADAMGVTSAGIFGDILTMRMMKRNVTALVTDGVVRDKAGVLASKLPVWCAGTAAPASVNGLTFVGCQDPIRSGRLPPFPRHPPLLHAHQPRPLPSS